MASRKRLTREHIDVFLTETLAGLLQRTRQTEPASVADLIRLVDVERIVAPPELVPREVIWEDGFD